MTGATKPQRDELLFAVLVFVNSTWIFLTYLSVTSIGTFGPATLLKALEGTADRPYVFRVLVPLTAKVVAPLIPNALTEWLRSSSAIVQKTLDVLSSNIYDREATAVVLIMFLSLVGFAYAEREFLKTLGAQPREQFVLSLLAQAVILPFSFFFAYYYDLPQILLVTLNLIFLKNEQWQHYLITLAAASFNKETSILLIVVFAIYYATRLPRRKFLELLFAQAVIYGLIRLSLLYIYRNNVGAPAFLTLSNHYEQYSSYPSTLLFTILFFVLIGFMIWRGWSQRQPFLKATLGIALLILVLFFTSGMPMEFRVFLDALPALVILIFPPLAAPSTLRGEKIVVK
jgi:hypothetical protein